MKNDETQENISFRLKNFSKTLQTALVYQIQDIEKFLRQNTDLSLIDELPIIVKDITTLKVQFENDFKRNVLLCLGPKAKKETTTK